MPVQPCFIDGSTNRDLDKAATPEFVSDLWRYAKANYADNGILHPQAIPQLAADLGMPERVVSYIMDKPKAVRQASQALVKLQRQRNQFLSDNRRYIANASKNDVTKVLGILSDMTRGSLLAVHGPVIGAIHPIDFLFTPGQQWKFLRQYGRGIKALSKDQMDQMLSGLKLKDRYQDWVDVGLPLEEKHQLEGFNVGGWGGRAMQAGLKPLMYEYAEQLWKNVPKELKTTPTGQLNKIMMGDVAQQAAFAAGAIPKGFLGHGPLVQAFSQSQLARSLNVARWMKSVIQPAQTIATLTQAALSKVGRPPPTPEALQGARSRLWSAGKYVGGMTGALIANDQINKMRHGERVNFSDPSKSDYFAFKFGDYYIKTRGTMEVLGIIARTIAAMKPYGKPKYGTTPEETFGRYTEYKLTPAISLGKELTSGRDVFGRPVPWSSEAGTLKRPKYTVPEYVGQHFPIFVGHGVQSFYEGLRDAGVDPSSMNSIMQGLKKHPEIIYRAGGEAAGEFIGLNLQRIKKKPGEA